jgi:hypothetical protein
MNHRSPSRSFDRATASRPHRMTDWQKEKAYGPIIPLAQPRRPLWRSLADTFFLNRSH